MSQCLPCDGDKGISWIVETLACGDGDLRLMDMRIRENVGVVPGEVAGDLWESRATAALPFGLWQKMVLPTCTVREDPLAQAELSSKFLVPYQIACVHSKGNFEVENLESQWQE